MSFNNGKFIQLCHTLKNTKTLQLSMEELGEMLHVYLLHNNFYVNDHVPEDDFILFVDKLMSPDSFKYAYIKSIFSEFSKKVSF